MKFAIALLSFVFGINMPAQSKPTADLIITNAKIWTGDKAHPTAQAVAVIGDRIVAIGSNSDVDILRGTANQNDRRGRQVACARFQRRPRAFRYGGDQAQSDSTE